MNTTTSSSRRDAAQTEAIAFDVVDVLGGFCTLERRSPTLGGSVPLRVAQACSPLLEGNAFGFQVTLHHRIELRKKLGRFVVTAFENEENVARLHRAGVPMLRAEGLLPPTSEWLRVIEAGIVTSGRPLLDIGRRNAAGRITLFTGLFVRPRPGIRLRQSSTKNRRSLAYDVREAILRLEEPAPVVASPGRAPPGNWIPIVLEIDPSADALTLSGEVATLAVLPSEASFVERSLDQAPDVAHAHLRFYDRAYFETKRSGDVSRKYRREIVGHRKRFDDDAVTGPVVIAASVVDCVHAGPRCVRPGHARIVHGPLGASTPTSRADDRLVFENPVPFQVSFDGLEVRVEPDAARLDQFAREVRASWKTLLDAAGASAHPGALLYLTKYFTPHPPGEPHFFVKPSALMRTPTGTSMLIEGTSGTGFEVMRGVVKTDLFHATPAVFHLLEVGRTIDVAEGTPLVELFQVPRALVDAGFTLRRTGPAAIEVRE